MKKTQKLFAAILSGCLVSSFGTMYVSAVTGSDLAPDKWNAGTAVVIGINEEKDYVYLSDGCTITQTNYQKYSGETNTLTYGDVITTLNVIVAATAPGTYIFSPDSSVVYYHGHAADYYSDHTEEMTVAEVSESANCIMFENAEGEQFKWYPRCSLAEFFGYTPLYTYDDFTVGDTVKCALMPTRCYNEAIDDYAYDWCIALPLLENNALQEATMETVPKSKGAGPGDVDENGDISIIDALLVNQVILNGRQLTETQSYVADVNRNGIVDASDALDILMHTIGLYTIS